MKQLHNQPGPSVDIELEDQDYRTSSDISVGARGSSSGLRSRHRYYAHCLGNLIKWLQRCIMALGCWRVAVFVSSILVAVCPDETAWLLSNAVTEGTFFKDIYSGPEAVQPVMCHSHNDERRARPFETAVAAGCVSIEADVFYMDGNLLVGHSRHGLHPQRTLEKLYLDPLLGRLNLQNAGSLNSVKPLTQWNGVFGSDPTQSLVLVIDMKREGDLIWPVLNEQLEPLRSFGYLSHFNGTDIVNGPITVVASGDASFYDIVRNSSYRDIFFDAPLDVIASSKLTPDHLVEDVSDYIVNEESTTSDAAIDYRTGLPIKYPLNRAVYSVANSYYASVSFKHSIGYPWRGRLSAWQINRIRQHIRAAHSKGLRVRYFGVPTWPLSMRNYLWRVLLREGVDVLNVDDIKAVTQLDFGPRKGGWHRKWWN